jgi:hypothetical protein
MKLTTVLASVNNNPSYYLFIPKQITFWNFFNIRFIAIFVGKELPDELKEYSENIILWSKNLELDSAYVAQNIRIWYPALITLPENELLMITDMDMLPMNDIYYKAGMDTFNKDDFIYYRYISGNQIFMCYNAATPATWSKVFNINSENEIESMLNTHYNKSYKALGNGWYADQEILYKYLINYPNLKVLNRSIKRLEVSNYKKHLNNNDTDFISKYDDAHFHRNFNNNAELIANAEMQLNLRF